MAASRSSENTPEPRNVLVWRGAAHYAGHHFFEIEPGFLVQFYPTLLPIAQKKSTLSANYLKEVSAEEPSCQH